MNQYTAKHLLRYGCSVGLALIVSHCVCRTTLAQEKSTAVPRSLDGWSLRIEQALKEGKPDEAIKEMNGAIEAAPKQSQLYIMRGSLLFRSGKIDESILDFDKSIELEPSGKPYLWQRGIALYYAGRYEDGRDQFAIHRDVNPNDVENAFWHFLCAAKLSGLDSAKKDVLLSGHDNRVPLMQIQELIQGKITPQDVIDVVEKKSNPKRAKDLVRFYGYLYIGLYFDAIDESEQAMEWLQKCVDEKSDGYMADVAKIHLEMLRRDKAKDKPKSESAK
jgi:lipoprotein NlpI